MLLYTLASSDKNIYFKQLHEPEKITTERVKNKYYFKLVFKRTTKCSVWKTNNNDYMIKNRYFIPL